MSNVGQGRELAYEMRMNNVPLEYLRAAIAAGADLTVGDTTRNRTALHWAAWHGLTEQLEILIEAGADPEQKSGPDDTCAVILAASNGKARVLETLAKAGVAFDTRDNNGNTAAHYALLNNHPEALAVLIDHCPALLTEKSRDGVSLFTVAEERSCGLARAALHALAARHGDYKIKLESKTPIQVRKLKPAMRRP